MKVTSRTDKGKLRPTNQDALLVCEGEYTLLGVADGMGGHLGGDVAGKTAVKVVEEELKNAVPDEIVLRKAFWHANLQIYDAQLHSEELSGMGTTLTVLWEDKDRYLIGHVGDSRAYLLRGGELTQLSCDHSYVQTLVFKGLITKEEARVHPRRNLITRAIGTDETVYTDVIEMDRQAGDKLLLCSDGLTEYLTDERLCEILTSMPAEEAADTLLNEALEAGGADNITLIIAEAVL